MSEKSLLDQWRDMAYDRNLSKNELETFWSRYFTIEKKIYEQLLDECDVAHITKIDYAYDADAYFPNLDEKPEWEITADSDEQTYFDLEFYFYKYERR